MKLLSIFNIFLLSLLSVRAHAEWSSRPTFDFSSLGSSCEFFLSQPSSSSSAPRVIVGLGNFGSQYKGTRHNIGFEVIDALISRSGAQLLASFEEEGIHTFQSNEERDRYLDFGAASVVRSDDVEVVSRYGGEIFKDWRRNILFVKPYFDINESGVFVSALVTHLGISPENVMVVYDNIRTPVNDIRLKKGKAKNFKSDRHNGLKSLNEEFADPSYLRVPIGVSNPKDMNLDLPLVDWVLGKMSEDQLRFISEDLAAKLGTYLDLALEGRDQETLSLFSGN